MNVIADADLSGHHDVVAGGGAAGDADLRAEQVVFSDLAVVGDHHLIVDLRAFADQRAPIGAAVDRGAGADFDVGFDLDVTKLGRKLMPALDGAITEAVGPNHRAGMDD